MRNDATRAPSVAILTPIGRGAVASIRVEGDLNALDQPDAPLFRAANGKSLSQQTIGRIAFGRWGRELDQGEDVVVCRLSPDALEIHCHGGDAAAQRIVDDLTRAGCTPMNWQNQLAGSHDGLEADCQEALSRCSTWRTAEIVHEQSAGLLRQAFDELVQLSSTESSSDLLRTKLDALLAWSRFGVHLSKPWNIVLTGRPNVGKSSLINALLGYQRAIVFDQPGTTRDVVTGETAFDGWPVLLADTAGLRDATEELEAAGIALARRCLESADLRLILIDLSEPPTSDDERLLAEWPDALIVGHKSDLPNQWEVRLPNSAIRVSSVTGFGLEDLQRHLVSRIVPEAPAIGTPVPINQRQVDLLAAARSAIDSSDLIRTRQAIAKLYVHDPS